VRIDVDSPTMLWLCMQQESRDLARRCATWLERLDLSTFILAVGVGGLLLWEQGEAKSAAAGGGTLLLGWEVTAERLHMAALCLTLLTAALEFVKYWLRGRVTRAHMISRVSTCVAITSFSFGAETRWLLEALGGYFDCSDMVAGVRRRLAADPGRAEAIRRFGEYYATRRAQGLGRVPAILYENSWWTLRQYEMLAARKRVMRWVCGVIFLAMVAVSLVVGGGSYRVVFELVAIPVLLLILATDAMGWSDEAKNLQNSLLLMQHILKGWEHRPSSQEADAMNTLSVYMAVTVAGPVLQEWTYKKVEADFEGSLPDDADVERQLAAP
jgi:hypothetical protein